MKTVSRVYDTYAQARNAVTAVEAAGVPDTEVSLVANKYVSDKYADVKEVSAPACPTRMRTSIRSQCVAAARW